MSYGFHVHPAFRVIGAVDAQMGKPSSGRGTVPDDMGHDGTALQARDYEVVS
jgi:DNA (cytosine-5)-methyltransferase 1